MTEVQPPNPDPSKKYWWVIGIIVPITVALIGLFVHTKNSNSAGPSTGGPPIIITPPSPAPMPVCSDSKRSEHDDALSAVHKYDEGITKYESELAEQNAELDTAQTNKDDIQIAEHKSLAALAQHNIQSLKDSRDEAMQRVRDIEHQCTI